MQLRSVAYSLFSLSLACSACAPLAEEHELALEQEQLSALFSSRARGRASTPAERCLFGATKQELLASPALSVGPAVRYTAESSLSPALAAQLSNGIDGLETPADLFAFVQDG